MTSVARILDAYRFMRTYGQHLPLAWDALFTMRCQVLRIRGSLRGDGTTLTLRYVGRRRRNLPYLVRAIFDQWTVISEEKATLFTFKRAMQRQLPLCDVSIVDIGWPYNAFVNRRGEYLEMPDWINMLVILGDDWDLVVRNFRQTARNNDLRLIRRNQYRYVTTTDRAAIEHFYDEIYVPFVSEKHDSDTILAPRRHVIARAMQGALLQVLQGDRIVAAGVVYREDDVLYFLWMGVPPECRDQPPEGAISALYYFGIRHAYEFGCTAVDLTGTRAFLNDGALRFKRKWGALVEDTFSPSSILLRPAEGNRAAVVFCARTPMIVRGPEGLEAMLTFREGTVDSDNLPSIGKQVGCAGVSRINVIEITGADEGVTERDGGDGFRYRHVKTRLENFAGWYRANAWSGVSKSSGRAVQ